jgi:pyruvate formate lyase activating enzyme
LKTSQIFDTVKEVSLVFFEDMNTLIRYSIGKAQLELVHLVSSPLFEQSEPTLQEIIEYVGYHPIRLQSEVRSGIRRCNTCQLRCAIATREFGRCHAVANAGTNLIATGYGLITGIGTTNTDFDFLHFHPDATVLYVAGLGCNFHCEACLNACITHVKSMNLQLLSALVKYQLTPAEVVDIAKKSGVKGIVFGGNEPTVNLDFVLDTVALAKQADLFVCFQTNGYLTSEAIELLVTNVDAAVVGLKAFGDVEVYKWLFKHVIKYEHILDSIKAFHERGVHVEVTGLVLKSANIEATAERTAQWLATNVSPEIPLHIHRMAQFYSTQLQESYELSSDEVNKIVSICRAVGLVNVYNRCEADDMSTYCPNCSKIVVQRTTRETALSCNNTGVVTCDQPEYAVSYVGLNVIDGKGYCASCRMQIYGKW